MANIKSDILTSDNNHLAIMNGHDGIQVDRNLLKYSSIKKEIEEFENENLKNTKKIESLPINMDIEESDFKNSFEEKEAIRKLMSKDYGVIKDGTVHQINVYLGKVRFDDIFSPFNSTVGFPNNTVPVLVSEGSKDGNPERAKKKSFLGKLSDMFSFKSKEAAKEAEETYAIDVLEFFSKVKGLSKENANTYVNRLAGYIVALKNCDSTGQTALKEKLLRDMVINKYESVLYSKGLYYVVAEDQVVEFVKKTKKGVRLTYVKNYMRQIPAEVVEKIEEINKLEIFDNYAVLHYDPEFKAFSETIEETKRRRDPILFGLIKGSNKLYYITDWVDDFCDLTLDKFVETLQIEKESLKLSEEIK